MPLLMMMRVLQSLIVIVGAVLAAGVAGCAARGPAQIIPRAALEAGLSDRFPGAQIILEDARYEMLHGAEVRAALSRARVPYRVNVADCDDVTADAVHHLRRARYYDLTRHAPPAAGRLSAQYEGAPHSLIWWVGVDGEFHVLEPMTSAGVAVEELNPWMIFDK